MLYIKLFQYTAWIFVFLDSIVEQHIHEKKIQSKQDGRIGHFGSEEEEGAQKQEETEMEESLK